MSKRTGNKVYDAIIRAVKVLRILPQWLTPKFLRGWRTLIVNVASLAAVILMDLNHEALADSVCVLADTINLTCSTDHIVSILVGFLAFINIILRLVTKGPSGLNRALASAKQTIYSRTKTSDNDSPQTE